MGTFMGLRDRFRFFGIVTLLILGDLKVRHPSTTYRVPRPR